MLRRSILLPALLFVVPTFWMSGLSTNARADVLYDQMTNFNPSGIVTSSWWPPNGFDSDTYSYDNFLLPSDSIINEVWWVGGGATPSGLTVRFYTGLAGAPDFQPTITALPENETSADYLRGYTFSGNGNQTAIPGSTLFQYHVVLPTPLSLPGNTVFWIKIEGDMASPGSSWGLAVATHGRDARHITFYTGLAQLLAGPSSEAFQLRGTVVVGACCLSNGSCTTAPNAGACAGAFQGVGSTCATASCPQPPGACCNGATCAVSTLAACMGVFQGAGSACGPSGNPTTCCPANFDGINGLQVSDIFAFLTAWFAGDPSANFDGVPGLQVSDIFAFLNAWFSGCP